MRLCVQLAVSREPCAASSKVSPPQASCFLNFLFPRHIPSLPPHKPPPSSSSLLPSAYSAAHLLHPRSSCLAVCSQFQHESRTQQGTTWPYRPGLLRPNFGPLPPTLNKAESQLASRLIECHPEDSTGIFELSLPLQLQTISPRNQL